MNDKIIYKFRGGIERLIGKEHKGNVHAAEYEAALTLIEKHAELWGNY